MSSLGIDSSALTLPPISIAGIGTITPASSSSQGGGAQGVGSSGGGNGPGASSQISQGGQLLSKLQTLQQQDPTKFKQTVTDIANQLQSAATNATGQDKQFLTGLAQKFAKAEGGDLSGFQPPAGASGNTKTASGVASQYQANQPQGLTLNSLAGTASGGGAGKSGGHHHGGHHHGGGGEGGSSTLQSALSTINSDLNSALGITSGSSSSSSGSSTTGSTQTTQTVGGA